MTMTPVRKVTTDALKRRIAKLEKRLKHVEAMLGVAIELQYKALDRARDARQSADAALYVANYCK